MSCKGPWTPGSELNSDGDYAPERYTRAPCAVAATKRGLEPATEHFAPYRPAIMAPGQCAYFDVDSTLVFASDELPDIDTNPANWTTICGREFYVHKPHVETIKDFKARGLVVVVWSAGGSQWAWSVVQALGLDKDVDFCLTKPNWIIDDKPPQAWLNESHRTYKEPK